MPPPLPLSLRLAEALYREFPPWPDRRADLLVQRFEWTVDLGRPLNKRERSMHPLKYVGADDIGLRAGPSHHHGTLNESFAVCAPQAPMASNGVSL